MIKDIYKKYKNIIKIAYVVCFAIVCMLCYTHAQPTKEERIFIFVSGQKYLKEDIKTELENIGKEYGILKKNTEYLMKLHLIQMQTKSFLQA